MDEMPVKEKLSIPKQEYDALSRIRGLSLEAHYMVMCATPTPDGRWILEGTDDAFDKLSSDLSEEIFEQLSPPTQVKQLVKLYDRLNPDSDSDF